MSVCDTLRESEGERERKRRGTCASSVGPRVFLPFLLLLFLVSVLFHVLKH
jgi:hypothetical protein